MAKKIRISYDILSMRAIETESGINIDEALRRKNQEIAEINESLVNIEGDIINIKSNFDFVVIDPVDGDDEADGQTRNTAVKSLSRAAELYVEKFGGSIVRALVVNTEQNEEVDLETFPGTACTPLYLPDLDSSITDVILYGDGAISLSNIDYQHDEEATETSSLPTYAVHAKFGGSIATLIQGYNSEYFESGYDLVSSNGDVVIAGSYSKDLEYVTMNAKNGKATFECYPVFNVYSGITCDFTFDANDVKLLVPVCGKDVTIIRRNTKNTGTNDYTGYSSAGLWVNGDLRIFSAGDFFFGGSNYVRGNVIIRTLEQAEKPTLIFYNAIFGKDNDNQGYHPNVPSNATFPKIDIDWDGTVKLPASIDANNIEVDCDRFSIYSSGSGILSENDIVVIANHIDMNQGSTGNYIYCKGKMKFRSLNEAKISQSLSTDELEINAGGRPNNFPISYTSYQNIYQSMDGVSFTSDIFCKIENLFETIRDNSAEPVAAVLSENEAHYYVKCSGDYMDYGNTFKNGRAIVTLDVTGHAYLSGSGSMIVKRLVLNSNSLFVSNGGLYSSSFNIRTGHLHWNNGGYLSQWVNYGGSWGITSSRGAGASWTNDFEDRSILECESLAQLTASTTGFVHPGYGTSRHDWDINIKVLVPYSTRNANYSGGTEYCAVLGNTFQGTPTGSIGGEIGDVLFTDCKISNFPHDWIIPTGFESYYNSQKVGCVVSLHFAHKKWHHVYLDMNQGADAYDGTSKETAVKSVQGLYRCLAQFQNPAYLTIHICGGGSGNNRGYPNSQWGPYNSLDFTAGAISVDQGLLYNFYSVQYINEHLTDLGIPSGWHVPSRNELMSLETNAVYYPVTSKLVGGSDTLEFSDTCSYVYPVGDYTTGANWDNPSGPWIWSSEYSGTDAYCLRPGNDSYSSVSFDTLMPIRLVCSNTEGLPSGTKGTVTIGGRSYNTVVIGSYIWMRQNLDYKFSGGTYRDGESGNIFTYGTSVPQYGYYSYNSNGYFSFSILNNPIYSLNYVTIVADDPYLSATVRGPIRKNGMSMLKMYGFHTLNVIDCYASVLDLQADVDLRYCYGFSYSNVGGSDGIKRLRGGNVYTYGFYSSCDTVIEADNKYACLSGDSNFGTSATPRFGGNTYIHAKYVEFSGTAAVFNGLVTIESESAFKFSTPCNIEYGSFTFIANGNGSEYGNLDTSYPDRSFFGIGTWSGVANVSLICPNQNLHVYTLGQSDRTNGRVLVEAVNLNIYGSFLGCDVDIRTKGDFTISGGIIGGGGRSSLVTIDCAGALSGFSTRACNAKINARKLNGSISIPNTGTSTHPTIVYVNTEYAANGVFAFTNPVNSDINLFGRVVELAGPFYVKGGTAPLTNDGAAFKKFKGLISFYTGSDPDNDLADFTEIAPNADFELIVLNRTKRLVAGRGINISDTGDQVVISSTSTGGTEVIQVPIEVSGTSATAELILNKYNVLTGLNEYVTDLDVYVPISTPPALTEVGFEFTPDSATTLSAVNFYNTQSASLFKIAPDEFYYGCVYQGAVINRCVTLVEYGDPVEPEPEPEGLVIDGKTYKTVVMPDGHEWMAENLAADSFGGVWYDKNKQVYEYRGKYYLPSEVDQISVPGWHVPTVSEMISLCESVDYEAQSLKSTEGWNDGYPGTDDYGFSMIPTSYGIVYPSDLSTYYFPADVSTPISYLALAVRPYEGYRSYSYLNLNILSAENSYEDSEVMLALPVRLVKDY